MTTTTTISPGLILGCITLGIALLWQYGYIDPFGSKAKAEKAEKALANRIARQKQKDKQSALIEKAKTSKPKAKANKKGKGKKTPAARDAAPADVDKVLNDLLKETAPAKSSKKKPEVPKAVSVDSADSPTAAPSAPAPAAPVKKKKKARKATPLELLDQLGSESSSYSEEEPEPSAQINPFQESESSEESAYVCEDFQPSSSSDPGFDLNDNSGWTTKATKGKKLPAANGAWGGNAATVSSAAKNQRILPGNLTAVTATAPKPARRNPQGKPRPAPTNDDEPGRGPAWQHAPRDPDTMAQAMMQNNDTMSNARRRLNAQEAEKKVKAAVKKGQTDQYMTVNRQFVQGGGQQRANNPNYATIAEEDTGHYAVPTSSLSFGKAIMKQRTELGMTQKELATKINEKPSVIQDYESGRAIPNGQVIQKLSRALGNVKLPKAKK